MDLPVDEIAELMNTRPGTVKSLLFGVCSFFGQDVALQVAASGRKVPVGGGVGGVKS